MARTMHQVHQLLHAHLCIHLATARISAICLLNDAPCQLIEQRLCVERRWQRRIVTALSIEVWVCLIEPQVVTGVKEVLDRNELHD